MRKKLKLVKNLHTIVGVILFAAFFFILAGTVGAIETDSISLAQGVIQLVIGVGICAMCLFAMQTLESFQSHLEEAIEHNDIYRTKRQMQWDNYFRTGDF